MIQSPHHRGLSSLPASRTIKGPVKRKDSVFKLQSRSSTSMSSIAVLEQEVIAGYVITSAYILFLYETVITIGEEVDVIWRRKWSAMTCIYALSRYSMVILNILGFPPYETIQSCKADIYTQDTLLLITFLCLALFSALRVYGLSGGRRMTAGLVFLLNLVPFGSNLYTFSTATVTEDSQLCTDAFKSGSAGLELLLSLFSRISVIVGDMFVLVVTWMKTAKSYREARRLNIEAPLSTMLIRDGTFYFVILLIINVLQAFTQNIPTVETLVVIEPFFQTLPTLIVCRFIRNLRQVKPAEDTCASTSSPTLNLRFVGNMGQSLKFGTDAEENEEQETEREEYGMGHELSETIIETTNSSEDREHLAEGNVHERPTFCNV